MIALDFSLSCPCMYLSTGPGFGNGSFWYLTSVQKQEGSFLYGKVTGHLHKDYSTEQERYENISQHFIDILDVVNISTKTPVFIEDYSFGSKGRVFGLAENTGLMKYKLWRRGHDITSIPPTVIKKFAVGKGNADKNDMYNAFFEKTNVDLHTNITRHKKLGSPVTDIVDAYFISELGWSMLNENNTK
jgi:Holliday junction resolvasome RuvABC endonuclease subunit